MNQLAQVNKGVLAAVMALLLVLMTGAWYMLEYKADKAAIATNQTALDAASTALDQKKTELAKTNVNKEPDRSAVPKIMLARTAIPNASQVPEGLLQVEDVANKAGVVLTTTKVGNDDSAAAVGSVGTTPTAQPIVVTVEGHAPYANIMLFVDGLESPVAAHGGKLYVAGRLMNVTSIKFDDGKGAGTFSGGADQGAGASLGSNEPVIPKSHRKFTIVITMYAVNATGASTTTTPATGTDPAAGATGAAAGTGATGTGTGATGTGAAGTGATGTGAGATTGTGGATTGTTGGATAPASTDTNAGAASPASNVPAGAS